MYIHNDPYRGQCHMPEHLVVKAVFWDGETVGFVGNIAHVGEIGGMAPGSFAPTRPRSTRRACACHRSRSWTRGEYVKDLWKVVLANHRTPKTSWGDYHAMIGSLHVAETARARAAREVRRRVPGRRRGPAPGLFRALHARRDRRDAGRRLLRRRTAWKTTASPTGRTGCACKLTIQGDEAICDWLDSDDQARGPINATFVVTAAACYSGFLYVARDDIPINSGCYRPIRLVTRPGSMVNVKHPGPVRWRQHGDPPAHPERRAARARGAVPDRVRRREGATACNFLFGGVHPEYGDYYTNYHIEGSGWGGTVDHDGNSVLCPNNGNCRNTPVEILETKYPFIVERYRLRNDSAGAGTFRGGLASSRIFRVTAPEITVSALFDRTKTQARGIFGGAKGTSGGIFIKRKGDTEFRRFSEVFGTVSDSKFTRVIVTEGDEIMLSSAGGGGYGDPLDRPRELVEEDVRQGFVSPDTAEREYGLSQRIVTSGAAEARHAVPKSRRGALS